MGKTIGISYVVAYAPTNNLETVRDKGRFWTTLGSTVAAVPKKEHLIVMTCANARTATREEGYVDDEVLGAYGRNTLNDNRRCLLAFSVERLFSKK